MKLPWKFISLSFLIGLILGAALGMASSQKATRRWMRQGSERYIKHLDRNVQLSDAQRSQVKALVKRNHERMRALREEIRQDTRVETLKLLTPEQRPAFESMTARHDARRKKWDGR